MSTPRFNTKAFEAFGDFSAIRNEIERFLDRPIFGEAFGGWVPPLDVSQDADHVYVTVELPGMKREDIQVAIQDGVLTVSGERVVAEENSVRSERASGKFSRSVKLPARVTSDAVSAAYKDGLLSITLPKAEEAKPKKIEISVN